MRSAIVASSEIVKIDAKGRLLVPSGFRDFLRLKEGSETIVSIDDEKARLLVTPTGEATLISMKIGIGDAPGSLARVAKALADEGVDLVSTESRSVARGKSAEWRVLCSAKSVKSLEKARKAVLKAGASSFSAEKL